MNFKYKGINLKLPELTINSMDALRGNTTRNEFVRMAINLYCCFLLNEGDHFDPEVEFDNDPRRSLNEGDEPWD